MHREDALYANSKTHAAHGERLAQQFATAAHHDALKWLNALLVAFAFLQTHVDLHRVARTEVRMVFTELRLLRLMHDRIHDYLFPCRPAQVGPASNAQSLIIARFQRILPNILLGPRSRGAAPAASCPAGRA